MRKNYESFINFFKDSKLEMFLFILLGSIFYFLKNIQFGKYLTFERLENISSLISVIIAVYLAVISILATSSLALTPKLLETKLDRRIINIITFGLFENFLSLVIIVFFDLEKEFYFKLLTLVVLGAFLSFIKFIKILLQFLKTNFDLMAEEIDERKRKEIEYLAILDNIDKKLERILKKK
ncbi:hypothetical protein [Fusobacterium necrophorum]|uniref:hypothetical protein n=1 Tax=Fusobacterium necrophorum TaxID=859 RepID=UPI00370E608B